MPDEIARRHADPGHDVVTVAGGRGMMRRPCPECPWRRVNAGTFPAGAFLLSASTAYDMARHVFGCHQAGAGHPMTCAGGAVRESHNLSLRMRAAEVALVEDLGAELFDDYREMAVANGVDPADPVLSRCR
jgi:hypothetical protein